MALWLGSACSRVSRFSGVLYAGFKNEVAEIEGWLTEAEGIFLYQTAKAITQGNVIVEIGSWKGRSTVCLGNGARDGSQSRVYAVDPHVGSPEHHKRFGKVDTYQEFLQNIRNAGVEQYVRPIRKASGEASDGLNERIEFLFVDGAHEFRLVRTDIESWFPKVTDGGIVAFHDTWGFLGPHLATAILLLVSPQVRAPRLIDTITCFRKVRKNSFFDRVRNILFLFYLTSFGWVGRIRLNRNGAALR